MRTILIILFNRYGGSNTYPSLLSLFNQSAADEVNWITVWKRIDTLVRSFFLLISSFSFPSIRLENDRSNRKAPLLPHSSSIHSSEIDIDDSVIRWAVSFGHFTSLPSLGKPISVRGSTSTLFLVDSTQESNEDRTQGARDRDHHVIIMYQ